MRQPTLATNEIKKLYLKETVLFAINSIPQVDRTTLEKFLELVNTTGTFGVISHDQIIAKMRLTLKYVPGACVQSLLILADLLEIQGQLFDQWPAGPAQLLDLSPGMMNQSAGLVPLGLVGSHSLFNIFCNYLDNVTLT